MFSFVRNLTIIRLKITVFLKHYILLALVALSWASCAPEKNGLVASVYHNTTARYNAYFYARQRMDEIELAIAEQQENNYNKVLRVMPEPDTSLISGMNEQIEDCISKASVAIERHPNSQWADDSYILIGMCRDFRQNYGDAINTYKFVNTQSEDDAARHQALVQLMQTFTRAQEQNNAIAVGDYLRKESLNRDNKVQLHLTKAYRAQLNEDYNSMVGNLLIAAPMLKKEEGRARIYFILGQLYQQLGFEAQAYDNYQQVLRANPEYELYFYARLNMAQVTDLSDESDVKKVRKFFRKLLRDDKNEEYRDKIYYELASFELRQGNLEEAIEYYNESVLASISNNRQKAYSYLALGQIYYDSLENYQKAKLYYDSTMIVLPQDEDDYDAIARRQEILTNFVEQLDVIQVQDSLLALAELDSTELVAIIDEIVEEQQRQQREEERVARREERAERAEQAANDRASTFGGAGNDNDDAGRQQESGEDWYFYNPSAVSQGRSAFTRRWGKRPLADDWRRSQAGTTPGSVADRGEATPAEQDAAAADSTQTADADGEAIDEAVAARQALYANVPFSEDQKQASLAMIEEAHYKLGGIYNFDLEEKRKAIETFETMLKRFPESEYEPEVLYLLYLTYRDLEDETYKKYRDLLVRNFPKTLYAKLVINPNYEEESNQEREKLKRRYSDAYALYLAGEDSVARVRIAESLARYRDNDFVDNMKLLEVLVRGRMEGEYRYQLGLQEFIEKYPESDVNAYAVELLSGIDNYKQKIEKRRGTEYIAEFDEPHSFIVVYKNTGKLSTELPKLIDQFNREKFSRGNLSSANLMLEDGKVMVLVEKFPSKETAEAYYRLFNGEASPLKTLPENYRPESIEANFAISEDNLTILYRTKDVEKYLRFFENHYMK